jgi:hypothetical protein
MTPFEEYTQRAADCRRQADAASLVNVRKRCLRAATAWQKMADRAQQNELYRAREDQRKAEQASARSDEWPPVWTRLLD